MCMFESVVILFGSNSLDLARDIANADDDDEWV